MSFAKIFKFGKKGAKMAAKPSEKKKADGGFDWPPGARIGVFGHSNAGKTVYFTVLNEDCKVSRDLQISVTDNATAAELLNNFKRLWGVGTHAGPGTHVDLQQDRQFPELNQRDKVLQFTAILDGSRKLPIVTYDYPGGAIDISSASDYTDKVADFMAGCDGLLFFFDPKVLGSEYQCHVHVASFVSMLEKLAPLEDRLPIPVALVVTKADSLPGFAGEEQTVLIGADEEPVVCEDYESFLEKVLTSERVTRDPAWSGTVRDVLVKTKEFIKVAVGRTLDFQIFFISQTGQQPEKIGAEEGRSLYKPPEKVRPVGVRKPMYWLVKAIARNRSLNKMRAFNRWVRLVSVGVVLVVSFFYAYHFLFTLARVTSFDNSVRNGRNQSACSASELADIKVKYSVYSSHWMVTKVFPEFKSAARDMYNKLENLHHGSLTVTLDAVLKEFMTIVNNEDLWPKVIGDGVVPNERTTRLETNLASFITPEDSTSGPALRAKRALELWELLKQCMPAMTDPTKWSALHQTIGLYVGTAGVDINPAESELFAALQGQKAREEERQQEEQAGVDFQTEMETINSNPDVLFRLDGAVKRLQRIRAQLRDGSPESEAVRRYIKAANFYKQEKAYSYRIDNLPEKAHIHVEVTSESQQPVWSTEDEWYRASTHILTWSPGSVIHIAICLPENSKCDWGAQSNDYSKLDDKYSIFQMEGDIPFGNIGKKATISFSPGLKKNIPVLEE